MRPGWPRRRHVSQVTAAREPLGARIPAGLAVLYTASTQWLEGSEMKAKVAQEYVQIQDLEWQPFPDALSEGGIRW